MADVKYIKIPTDFFSSNPIAEIESRPEGDSTILLYIELLCIAYRKSRKGIFKIGDIVLTDEVLSNILPYNNVPDKLEMLESYGLIKRCERAVVVLKFWEDRHDRNSFRYREWRTKVFQRDGYRCVVCGTNHNLQAHHIEHWKENKVLRYEVENGITLCRKCHLKEHGGSWRNG